jgi:hypothetical protein
MSTNPDSQKRNKERILFSETQRRIYGWYAYTAIMIICMSGGIIATVLSLVATTPSAPAGGITLLWRIPLALGWFVWTLAIWYRVAKFWDPSNVEWVDKLLLKLRFHRK